MDKQDQILAEIQGMKLDLTEVRSAVIGTPKEPGHGEQLRALQRQLTGLQNEFDALYDEVQNVKNAAGRVALRGGEAIALAILIATCLGLGGLVWSEIHPSPAHIEDAARAAGKGAPH